MKISVAEMSLILIAKQKQTLTIIIDSLTTKFFAMPSTAAASLPSDSIASEPGMSGFSNNQLITASILDSRSLPKLKQTNEKNNYEITSILFKKK